MEFKKDVVNNLVKQISDYFPKIQCSPSFTSISRKSQMVIARKRLNYLMEYISISQDIRKTLLYNINFGLEYFFF